MRFPLLVVVLGFIAAINVSGQDFRIDQRSPVQPLASANGTAFVTPMYTASSGWQNPISDPDDIFSVQRQHYKVPTIPGERRIKAGRTLFCIGAATIIAGILVYNNRETGAYTNGNYNNTYYYDDPNEIGGQMLVGVGSGLLVSGAMVWIHGSRIYRKNVEKQLQGLYLPAGRLGIGYRF